MNLNYIRRFKLVSLLLVLGVVASSCLDDEPYLRGADDTDNVIEFYTTKAFFSTEGSYYAIYKQAFDTAPEKEMSVIISYSGTDVAPQDITVTVQKDSAAISRYNRAIVQKARKTAIDGGLDPDKIDSSKLVFYDKLPEDLYSLASNTVIIPKGQRQATLTVKVRPDQFDFAYNYALGLTISSASYGNISGNFGTVLYSVSGKNEMDGVYTIAAADATFKDANSSANTGDYPKTIHLISLAQKKVGYFDPSLNGGLYGYTFSAGYFGSWAPVFEFDDNDNIIAVTNYYGQPAWTGSTFRSSKIDPSGVNKITRNADGSIATMQVSYFMLQGAGNPSADPARLSITEKFVYSDVRPE